MMLKVIAQDICDLCNTYIQDERRSVFTFAESCTGGLVASTMTRMPGVSNYFTGSVVTYSDLEKIALLNVAPETLQRHGAVSGQCAAEMAAGVRDLFSSDIAVSITGIAGPDGGSPDKPVGTVWMSSCTKDGKRSLVKYIYKNKKREEIQQAAALSALKILFRELIKYFDR